MLDIDIKEILKQTKTVLVTQEAFDELVKRASAQAQPEIIHCRDCKHWKTDHPTANGYHCCHRIHNIFPMREDDFCSRAERRGNEEKNRRTNQSIR